MKQTFLNLMNAAGGFAPFRVANRDKALILTYHRFSQTGTAGTTSAQAFAEQLEYLTTYYRVVPLSQLVAYLATEKRLPSGLAAIAIDDGYRDAYDVAFPILRRYGAPATLFVATDFVDGRGWLWTDILRFVAAGAKTNCLKATINNRELRVQLAGTASRLAAATQLNERLKLLPDDAKERAILEIAYSAGVDLPDAPPDEYAAIDWEQAREMSAGGVEIGSHTLTHPILTRVPDDRLRAELCDSRARIEQMVARPADLFCYPNGDYDERVYRAAKAAGYRCAVTIEPGLNGPGSDLFKLRRVHTQDNLVRFIQNTSGFEQVKNRILFARAKVDPGTERLMIAEQR